MKAARRDTRSTDALAGRRVIFVLGSLELGGAERQALLLARHLRERACAEVEVWGFNREGPVASLCERHDIGWRVVPFDFACAPPRRLARLSRLARTLRAARPDLLLPYTLIPNVACGLVWRPAGARACVWNQRDPGVTSVGRLWERAAVRLTPRFVSNSREGARHLTRSLKARPSAVRVIQNGVELDAPLADRAEWRARLGVGDATFIACMIANLHRYKDHATLLRAWRIVLADLEARGRDALLVLAGRLDDAYYSLVALARELEIDGRVLFTGYVSDVAGLVGASDLCVHSSRFEGGPNAVLECMAAGLAVAGTDIEAMRLALGDASAPYLAPPSDAEALARAVLKLAHDPALRDALGAQNRRRALAHFAPARMCEETAALLAACLAAA